MNSRCRKLLTVAAMMLMLTVMCSAGAFASDDNSLASLGIKTEGVTVSPEFRYDIWEYSVEVPAGTTTLDLEPHTTNPSATVNSVTGTTLNADGTGTVVITVTSESGNAIEYVLNVSSARGAVDPAAAIAANEKRSHISMLTYVLYALIAVSIVFLFIVISQLLRRRDMAQELAFYKNGDPGRSGAVAEDGWGDWGEEDGERSSSVSWTDQQVGTPVQPQRHMSRNGQYPADGASRQGNAPRQAGAPRQGNAPRQNSAPRQASAQRQNGAPRQNGAYRQEGVSSETRRYESVQPVHPQEVPKDVTKDLTRVKKAEAKAMKKAAAAEAKREQESRKAAQARAEEAKRQAQEAQRIEREQEAARKAQEEALEKAARQDAARHAGSAQGAADQGKNVKIDLIDL